MSTKTKLTLDHGLRVVVTLGLMLSVLGTSAVVPVAQASTATLPVDTPQAEQVSAVGVAPEAAPAATTAQPAWNVLTFDSPLPTPQATPQPMIAPPLVPVTATLAPSATQVVVGARGGRVATGDRRVQLDVPPGLFQRNTRLKIAPRATLAANAPAGIKVQFDLTAQDNATGAEMAVFEKPITLTVDLNGLIDRTRLQPFEHLAIFYQTGNPDAPWSELADAREVEPGVLQVPLVHFSTYAAASSGDQVASWHLKYIPPTVGLFSGAATFAYPIEVPAGRSGLQPNIMLAYSSRAIDGLTYLGSEDTDGVPPGWSLDMASIARNGMKYQGDGAHKHMYFPERFSLAINGSNYDLFPATAGAHCGRYYAKDAPGLYIERRNAYAACNNGTTTNSTREYWIVKTGDGTIYRFGYNSDSEQYVEQNAAFAWAEGYAGYRCTDGDPSGGYDCWGAASRWRVDRVTDVYNNVMTFSYRVTSSTETPPGDSGGQQVTTEHTRVNTIDYNGSLSRIEFTNSVNANYNWIDRVRVYNNNNANKIREYRLQSDAALHRLLSITPYDGASLALPATAFTHIDLNHDNNLPFPYIQRIDNGYGGATEFTYDWDGRKEKNGTALYYGYSYRVIETRTYDGWNATPARRQYAYSGPCYDQWQLMWNPGLQLCKSANAPEYGPLVGYAAVTETVLNYEGTAAVVNAHRYYTEVNTVNSPLRGREYWSRALDASSTPLAQTDTTYATQSNGSTTFTAVSQADETTYGSGTSITQRTRYDYDALGHVAKVREYAKASDATPYRTTTTDYVTNTTAWIVDTPYWVRTYAGGTSGGTLLKEVQYSYDRNPDGTVPPWRTIPLRGEMVFEDVYGDQPDVRTWTNNWYDSYGNLKTMADAKGNTTRTYYDTTYNLYPVQIVNAKTQTMTMTYNLALGLVTQATDPNNAVTQYQYDTFGRLLKVAKPYDSLSIPTVECIYVDGYNINGLKGLKVQENYREQSGNANAFRPIIKFYDGLGRLVQERDETLDGSQQSVSNVTYDSRGLKRYAYVPAFESFSSEFSRPSGWDTRAKTISDYDALGRTIATTAPDGTVTTEGYNIDTRIDQDYRPTLKALHWVQDANSHVKQYISDAFGRLVMVRELNGTASPHQLYAETVYTYTILDNLTEVRDGLGNTTVMTYNTLGQKIGMIDPDMGAWSYQYDAAGNLITQTDAIGNVLWFKYDEMNRLIEKRQTGSSGNRLASYGYDSYDGATQFGLGRRTSMTDSSGNATWTYDQRGRVTQESKTINGAGTFNTSYNYDAMDRVKTITYPTGEVVNQTYNPASQLTTVYGTNTYASGMTYNALGQIKQVTLGNGATTAYDYYGNGGPAINSFRLWRTQTTRSGTNLLELQYNYDNVGNVKVITDVLNSNQLLMFNYDALDRLTWATTSAGNGQYSQGFDYNPIGNLTSKAGVGYSYPSAGQARPHAVQRVAGSGGASKTIQIRAYSTPCDDGVGATMELWVNGSKQQTWTNVSSSWTLYSQNVTLSGNDEIEVVFTNDCGGNGYDRNLIVDYIVVDGRTFQAEGGAAVLDRGNAFDGQDVLPGQEGLWWTGGLRLVVGAKAFAGCYDANGNMTCRLEDGAAYLQTWDTENRVSRITGNGQDTQYFYDGDGNRVKKVDAFGTTVYVGSLWEQFTPAQSGTNVAQGKTASQSSTHVSGAVASRAVDGNTDGYFWNNSVTHTSDAAPQESQAWWQVDLGASQPIQSITLWNRTDCCGDRLSNFYVLVSDVPFASTNLNATLSQPGVSSYYFASVGTNASLTVNRMGRYVRVQLAGTNVLSLAEVQVWSGPLATSYYFAGSQRAAMRQGAMLYYFVADHLGSTSLTLDANGNKIGEMKYYPFGETRYVWGSTPTDRRFTGQREESGLGSLYDYGARMYSPVLGRFLSADTIVPSPADPQQLNRYVYGLNNPVKYRDPSGHMSTGEGCQTEGCSATQWDLDRAVGNAERAKSAKFYRDCANGGGIGCPNVGEVALFAFNGFMSIGSLPFVVAGTLGITGYTVGNGVANKLNGQDFFSNWDVRDAALSYGFSGVTGGIIKPSLASLGFQGPVVTGVTAGVMSGAQYIVRQNLYNNGKIDSSALFVQSTFSMFASSGSASLVGSSSSLGAQLGRTLVSSVSKGAVLGELKAISGWIANTIDISLRIAARQAYSKYNYGTNDIFAYPAY